MCFTPWIIMLVGFSLEPCRWTTIPGMYTTFCCTEIHPHGWYQPLMLNHAALERMRASIDVHGFTKTCMNFGVSQDVGMGIHAWLHSLTHLFLIPDFTLNTFEVLPLPGGSLVWPYVSVVVGFDHELGVCEQLGQVEQQVSEQFVDFAAQTRTAIVL
eukprot:gene37829-46675_t